MITISPSTLWGVTQAFGVINTHQMDHWSRTKARVSVHLHAPTIEQYRTHLNQLLTVKAKWAAEFESYVNPVSSHFGPDSEFEKTFDNIRSKSTQTSEWVSLRDDATQLIEIVVKGIEKIGTVINFLDSIAKSTPATVFPETSINLETMGDAEVFSLSRSASYLELMWFSKLSTAFENSVRDSVLRIPALLKDLKTYFGEVQKVLEGLIVDMNDLVELTFFTKAEHSISGLLKQSDDSKQLVSSFSRGLSEMASYRVTPARVFAGRANTDDWLEGGWWNNKDLACRRNPRTFTEQAVSLPIAWPSIPRVIVGIKTLHCGVGDHLRAEVRPVSPDNTGFDINMNSWIGTTDLKQIEACYLAITPKEVDIQCAPEPVVANWKIQRFEPNNLQSEFSCEPVVFERPYDRKPTVLVWLTHIDSNKQNVHRIEVSAANVTTRGFTLEFRSWLKSAYFKYKASWIAFSEGRKDIRHYQYQWMRPSDPERCHFYALTKLDADNNKNIRVTLNAHTATSPTIETWGDSKLYDAKYIGIYMKSCKNMP